MSTTQGWRPGPNGVRFCPKSEVPRIFGGGKGGKRPIPVQIIEGLHRGRFPGGFYGGNK